eukprot:TRINITY_DN933_c0_g3_i1.p1 TRINITY_DN933_c0_g3~~TRINITY_DN933_c0_g3_i1.p1  ORF type:complete len:231 (+),score=61.35 TRINITY_DN933_c0_g3_i1:327-1019(+)
MGNNLSNVEQHFTAEYERVNGLNKGPAREYLVLDQVLQMAPARTHPADFSHLGTLFVLDREKNGKFTRESIAALIHLGQIREAKTKSTHDFQQQFQAYCTLRMWCNVGGDGGDERFAAWVVKLFSENTCSSSSPVRKIGKKPYTMFLRHDTVKTLHELLNIKQSYGVGFQKFFDLMQRVAEEQGLMSISNEALDYVVPIKIIEQFAMNFLRGFRELMADLGFDPQMGIDD